MPAISKRSPFPPLTMQDESDGGVSQLFRRMFNEPVGGLGRSMLWSPTVEVEETTDAITLTAELPGMTEDDVTLTLENSVLSITGEKRSDRDVREDEGRYLLSERFYGSFQRSFTLPSTVDVDAIKAAVDKGVLTVTLPKTPQAKGRVIKVGSKK